MVSRSPVRAPASLYLVVGILAAFGALMLVRLIVGMIFSVLTVVVVVGLIALVVSAWGRRGSR